MCFASSVSVDHLMAFGQNFVSSSLSEPILILLSSRMHGFTKQTRQTPKPSQYLLSCGRPSLNLHGPLLSQPLFLFASTPSPIRTATALSPVSCPLQLVEHNQPSSRTRVTCFQLVTGCDTHRKTNRDYPGHDDEAYRSCRLQGQY
jgi:hypothetical protein